MLKEKLVNEAQKWLTEHYCGLNGISRNHWATNNWGAI